MYADDLTIYACINNEMDIVKFHNELNIFITGVLNRDRLLICKNVNLCILDIIIININKVWVSTCKMFHIVKRYFLYLLMIN